MTLVPTAPRAAPFDTGLLDTLLSEAGLDLLLVTSKHNVQFLLGGHRAMFFDYMDAMGVSRYLPVLAYPAGRPHDAIYVGHRTETNQKEVQPFWIADQETTSWGSVDAIEKAVARIQAAGLAAGRIGIESSFLPFDSAQALQRLLPGAELVEALPVLERLRERKTAAEIAMLRTATERVNEAMAEVFAATRPGMTKRDLVQRLREAETSRGLVFEYCLVTAGTGMNRAPSDQVVQPGDVISLDSGANYHGYLGDICRMGVVGDPDAELTELLDIVEAIQQAAIGAVRPGALGGAVYEGPARMIAASPFRDQLHFVGHGMGLVTHEAPHLTAKGPVPYPDDGAHAPLRPGMVLSVETTLRHPTRGFIKLEDTVAVTETGHELFGATMRGWQRAGAARIESLVA